MMHPHTTVSLVDSIKGRGVIATQFIPKGTAVFVTDELDIKIHGDHPLMAQREYLSHIEKFGYKTLDDGYVIGWDHSKYVNHCCEPNTISTGWGFEIALRSIAPGEELTDEYGLFNIEQDFDCSCMSQSCRKKIRQKDFETLVPIWDKKVQDALIYFNQVDQPLLPYLDPETLASLRAYGKDPGRYISVITNIIPSSYGRVRGSQEALSQIL
jgi:hypothetical protein